MKAKSYQLLAAVRLSIIVGYVLSLIKMTQSCLIRSQYTKYISLLR